MREVLLDSNPLQKDLRIRLPKQILSNLPVGVGTIFDIYLCPETNDIILRIQNNAASPDERGNFDGSN